MDKLVTVISATEASNLRQEDVIKTRGEIETMTMLNQTHNHEIFTPSQWLQRELKNRQLINPSYSLRAFARKVGIAPSRLSELLNEKRVMTRGQLMKISLALALDQQQHQEIQRQLEEYQRLRRTEIANSRKKRALLLWSRQMARSTEVAAARNVAQSQT